MLQSNIFNNSDNLITDSSFLDITNVQNVKSGSYNLQNFFLDDSTMTKSIEFATQQSGIFYKGSFQTSIGGGNIEDNSGILLTPNRDNQKTNLNLFHRPFGTTPYLGRGSVESDMESQILQGELNTNKKSITKFFIMVSLHLYKKKYTYKHTY